MRCAIFSAGRVHSEVFQAAGILSLSVFVSFVVHGIPSLNGVAWGARLLPLYYVPFAAVVFLRLPFALVMSLGAPYLNHVFTHNPVHDKIMPLSGELILFTLGVYALVYFKRSYCIPLACVAAKAVVFFFMFLGGRGDVQVFVSSLVHAMPGLIILLGGGVWLRIVQKKKTEPFL